MITRYAKLIDSYPLFAPRHLTVGENVIYNPPGEIYLEQGWLPVRFTEAPEAEPGWHYEESWSEESGEIVQGWVRVADPDDVDPAEAMEILFGGES